MKTEKAIERMKSYKKMHADDYFDIAISALEKQIPKKPIMIAELYHNCPACGWEFLFDESYCPHCSQALKWEETK